MMGILEENRRLEDLDKQYIWHPFTQMKDWIDERPVIITEGRDCFIKDIYGNWYLDGVSSLWVNIHGHRKQEIDEAIKEQINRISHTTMLGMSNAPAINLAERLVKLVCSSGFGVQSYKKEDAAVNLQSSETLPLAPARHPASGPCPLPLNKVFYSDNGSTAVEVSLKMAFQYWQHMGLKDKTSFLSLNNAYHGDTLGAVSVGGVDIFHNAFGPLLFKTYRAPSPYCYRCELDKDYPECNISCLNRMEDILRTHSGNIAAVITEPLVQAAGGMIVWPEGYLKGVSELCTKYNVLLIADEVATGFGRTGKMFACEHEGVMPDIICLSKGITGGYLPLAVTIANEGIYRAFLGEFKDLKTFFHGHSYTGNPLGCAAALACLNVFEKEKTIEKLGHKVRLFESLLEDISGLEHVGNVRSRGLMAGIELVKDRSTKEPYPWEDKIGWKVAYYARNRGVFIRPLGNTVIIMPPLAIQQESLERMLRVVKEGITEATL